MLNKQGDNIQPWYTAFPIWNQYTVPCLVLTVASWPAYRFRRRQSKVVWYYHLFESFPQFIAIHTVRGFSIASETVELFLEFPCIFYDPTDVGSLFPLPFLNPACTSGSSQFTYCWSLAWRILSITLLAFEMNMCGSLNFLWHCPSLELKWKLTFSSPVALAKVPKFASILNAALSQHHLLGFEITQL